MLKKILLRIIERRHYWRTVGFSQLAELYANRMMRVMAVNMVAGITAVFLYQLGYQIWHIALIFAIYFAARGLFTIPAAYLIGWVGPKHATLISNILYVPGLISLSQLRGGGLGALAVYLTAVPLAVSLYNVAYHVGFSKVKTSENAGKEIGFMYIAERVGTAISPIAGGFIAYWFGPEATMWAASGLMLLSVVPLLFSPETVMTNQHIVFRGFNWRDTWRQLISAAGSGVDQIPSGGIWVLFVAVVVLGTSSDVVYAELGGLIAVSFISSILFSRLFGLIIDRKQGLMLMRTTVVGNAMLHIARIFVTTPLGVVLINVINEATTVGYAMPYLKGEYDMADDLPGYRIVYIALMDISICVGATVMSLIIAGLAYSLDGVLGLQVGYVLVGVMSLLILTANFPALRKQPFYRR